MIRRPAAIIAGKQALKDLLPDFGGGEIYQVRYCPESKCTKPSWG